MYLVINVLRSVKLKNYLENCLERQYLVRVKFVLAGQLIFWRSHQVEINNARTVRVTVTSYLEF